MWLALYVARGGCRRRNAIVVARSGPAWVVVFFVIWRACRLAGVVRFVVAIAGGVLWIAIALLIGRASSLSATLVIGSLFVVISLRCCAVAVCVCAISFIGNLLCRISSLIFAVPIAAAKFL